MDEKYEELKREAKKVEKKIMDAEDALAREGVSFEEMVEKTREDRIELFKLSKEMRDEITPKNIIMKVDNEIEHTFSKSKSNIS